MKPSSTTPRLRRWQVKLSQKPTASLTETEWDELLALFQHAYSLSMDNLQQSIRGRSNIYLVRERATGRLLGSNTTGVMEVEVHGRKRRVIYGGDACFRPECRGLGMLQEMGILELANEVIRHPFAERYLFGIALYKMYLAGVRSFIDVWPRIGVKTPDDLLALMEIVGSHMYEGSWNGPTKPMIGGRLGTQEVIAIPPEMMSDPDVRFYAECNPTYLQGSALPCLIRLDMRNAVALLKRFISRAPRLTG
jgi:hypothetical protein